MSDPLAWIDSEAAQRVRLDLWRRLATLGPATPGQIECEGRTVVNFASNDYLGLASDPRVIAAAREAAERFGWGAGASPLVSGWRQPHQDLADALAAFEQTEAALLFPTGFAAGLGTIVALVGPGDAIYCDKLDHACLIDGARLSGAKLRVYPHADAGRLDAILARDAGRFRRRLIATESVFSMDGTLAPLAHLVEIAERYDAILLVDEAHGTGIFGPDGRGVAAAEGVSDRVHVKLGTLSKALGSIGGFVAGSRRLIEHLVNHARTAIFSTALPPAAAAAALQALAILRAEPWRRERALMLGDRLRRDLSETGWRVLASVGPIVPIVMADSERAVSLSRALRERGFLVPAIRPPTVPHGTARLRVSLSAVHADCALDGLVQSLDEAREAE